MAIISCTKCGQNISSEAITCPFCKSNFQSAEIIQQEPSLKPLKYVEPTYTSSNTNSWTKLWWLGLVIAFFLVYTFTSNNKTDNQSISIEPNSLEKKPIPEAKPCIGSKDCIHAVRTRCRELNYDIMGEEYLGNGIIGISAIDYSTSLLWNITFLTDCNCEIINVKTSLVK